MHRIPQQVFNATLLGLVLGLMTVRANSLLPAIVFHVTYNSLQILRSRVHLADDGNGLVDWFVTVHRIEGETIIAYDWPTLVVAGVVAIALLRWLVKHPGADEGLNSVEQQLQTAESAEADSDESSSIHVG